MFRKMPFILLAIILATMLLGEFMPHILQQILYSISLTIKTIIVTLLPFIILGLLFKATVVLSSKATKIIGLMLALVCFSNFISTFISHYVGIWIYGFDLSIILPKGSHELTPLWSLELPKLIPNNKAMFIGIILGLIASKLLPVKSKIIAEKIETYINKILQICTYLIPLFITGFIVKLAHDQVLSIIVKDYAMIFLLIACAQFCYITLTYFVLCDFRINRLLLSIKNMLPAAICGFSTMSSAASMPLTIIGAENNAKNKDIVRSVIPVTVNIHLVGDCFAIPIFAYAILKSFGIAEPSLYSYIIFSFYFVLAKFSVAAIPGGGIIVMLPILESYLGFNADMMSIITSLYILFDPVVTCANILGNGAFAKMIDRIVTQD